MKSLDTAISLEKGKSEKQALHCLKIDLVPHILFVTEGLGKFIFLYMIFFIFEKIMDFYLILRSCKCNQLY